MNVSLFPHLDESKKKNNALIQIFLKASYTQFIEKTFRVHPYSALYIN